jgi:hypothetical protein
MGLCFLTWFSDNVRKQLTESQDEYKALSARFESESKNSQLKIEKLVNLIIFSHS